VVSHFPLSNPPARESYGITEVQGFFLLSAEEFRASGDVHQGYNSPSAANTTTPSLIDETTLHDLLAHDYGLRICEIAIRLAKHAELLCVLPIPR
jgi:hypothetical protein